MQRLEVQAWIDERRDEVVAYLGDLIRAGSPAEGATTPEVAGAVAATVAAAERLGFEVDVRRVARSELAGHPAFIGQADGEATYVVARRRGAGGGRSLVLNGHIDVVESGDESLWTHPPFAAEIVDGLMYGRGTSDAKGPFVAALFGAACAADLGELAGDVAVVAATDEEVGGMSTLASLLDGVRGDAVLVGEPTELGLAPASRGLMAFRLTVEGRSAHAGAAFQGVNAIVKAAACVEALDALQAELDERFPNELYAPLPLGHCINIGMIRGGEWTRSVPDLCTVEGSAPVIGTDDPAAIRAAVEERLARVADTDPWLREHRPKLEWLGFKLDAAVTESSHPLLTTASEAIEQVVGNRPTVLPLLGASDFRFYAGHFDVPGTHFGPGAMSRGHGVDEYVELEGVATAVAVVARIVDGWCGATR